MESPCEKSSANRFIILCNRLPPPGYIYEISVVLLETKSYKAAFVLNNINQSILKCVIPWSLSTGKSWSGQVKILLSICWGRFLNFRGALGQIFSCCSPWQGSLETWAAAETEELYKKKYSPTPKHFWTSPKAGCSLVELADEIGVQDVLQ